MSVSSPTIEGAFLSHIAQQLAVPVHGDGNPRVAGLHHDSRHVQPGDLFVARQGERSDGLRFVPQAIERGAVALMTDSTHAPFVFPVPTLLVPDIRSAIGNAANTIYGNPTAKMDVVGITGTNGKTTSSFMVRSALEGVGKTCGILGTLGAAFGDLQIQAAHTTPEADEIARVAFAMRKRGATHLVMEVSSHALDQRRADSVQFRVAAFTNLTQDHLDYHKTIDAYAAAKDRLFFELSPQAAVIMVDDAHGASLSHRVQGSVRRCLRVSTHPDACADIRPDEPVRYHARGLTCRLQTPSGPCLLDAPFVGPHNLANLLLALGIISALDLSVQRAAEALTTSPPVPGRLERCDSESDDITVLVDYAHTPDALERALHAIRPLTKGRVLCAFGCGGDRDRAKRPIMGSIVGQLADVAVVTNDNPRTEDPCAIVNAILDGMHNAPAHVVVERDRSLAIDKVIQTAQPGDVVLIAGKGHEPYQIIGEHVHHFDDRQQARHALHRRQHTKQEG